MDFKGKDKTYIDEWVRTMLPNLDLSAYERLGYLRGYFRIQREVGWVFSRTV